MNNSDPPSALAHNLRAVDLNLLVVLDVLLHERHLTRAAARLPMSQPAVSHALARLRTLLGDPLFHRTRGGLRPTPHALALEAPLRDVLAQVRRLLAGAVFEPAASRRTFRLAMSDYGASVVLPPLVRRLRAEAPGIDLEISYTSRGGMIAGVADGQLDLALAVFGETPADIRRAVLFQEPFVCVMDAAGTAGPLTLDDYLARPHVLVAASQDQRSGEVDAALARLGRARRVALRLPHWTAAPAVVAGTDLVLTVAQRTVMPTPPGLAVQPVPFPIAPLGFEMIWHERTDGDAGLRWLRESLAALMG
ncbi:PCP degradation transcriptional activation protein [Achromobacter deleyi]|uniref:PCP degradation transcriptional activation protein n=1 Tax=Achromobacter deleyi TaxID=1353891 RepID=A0A6S7AQ49_9BURK|nr:LysR family transcriptional regulator [Achromobacter deleyi]CAB3743174.1 PCP degradation transcriptional activation protein [Achromobacter deleyi]CAB3925093.1 PCP degradation transcriptional activation protein [Achromobacter deleyi]CAB3927187.1 PCP degradation transcriptional activation protein [Achromobacter deleyi]